LDPTRPVQVSRQHPRDMMNARVLSTGCR
jgi:hypothetical protein